MATSEIHAHAQSSRSSTLFPSYYFEMSDKDDNDLLPPLEQSRALPLIVKKRKPPPSTYPPISDNTAALQHFDQLISEYQSAEAAFLLLIQRYKINLDLVRTLGVTKLKLSFSRVTWLSIAPIFGLDPADTTLSTIEEFSVHRSWLPLAVIKDICRDIEQADVQYGQLFNHNNEEARSRYIANLFNRTVCLFRRKITNRPEQLLEGEVTDRGRVEHQFLVFGAVVVLFIEVKKDLLSGEKRLDQLAQVLAEADACDFRNASYNLWVPIVGILCDGREFQFFVYDSSTRKFSLSDRDLSTGLDGSTGLRYLRSIRRTSEYLFDLFLVGYINGLHAFLAKSSAAAAVEGAKRVSTDHWIASLQYAEHALRQARQATQVALAGDSVRAENMAVRALESLERSVDEAPGFPKTVPGLLDAWDDEEMMNP